MSARVFRYPAPALRSAYALGVVGMAIGFVPLLIARPAALFRWALAATGLLFLVYFARTVVRQLTCIELTEEGLGVRGPLGVDMRWDDVRAVKLNYFSTRPDRSGGWMEYIVQGPRRSIRIESTLEGFADLVRASTREARSRGIALDERTRANLHALGIDF